MGNIYVYIYMVKQICNDKFWTPIYPDLIVSNYIKHLVASSRILNAKLPKKTNIVGQGSD